LPRHIETFASWIVAKGGWRALSPCIDLLLVWSFATDGGRKLLSVSEVQKYAERTHWGSEAKFYRHVKLWREVTELDSPGVVLLRVRLSKERKRAAVQALSLTTAQVGVV
jgi:hypothetical protein